MTIRALAGSIDIRSQRGQGLTIELRFQASLVATHALFVRDGGQVFGLASHAVQRAIDLSRDKYCSVWHSLRRDIQFETTFEVRA